MLSELVKGSLSISSQRKADRHNEGFDQCHGVERDLNSHALHILLLSVSVCLSAKQS